jgi:hypothetical protein
VLGGGPPSFRDLIEERLRFIADLKASHLATDLAQAAVRQLPVLGLERPEKLLVTPFQQGVIPTTRLQTIEVLSHPMKHQLTNRSCLFQRFGFHAWKITVTNPGDKSDIAGTF